MESRLCCSSCYRIWYRTEPGVLGHSHHSGSLKVPNEGIGELQGPHHSFQFRPGALEDFQSAFKHVKSYKSRTPLQPLDSTSQPYKTQSNPSYPSFNLLTKPSLSLEVGGSWLPSCQVEDMSVAVVEADETIRTAEDAALGM